MSTRVDPHSDTKQPAGTPSDTGPVKFRDPSDSWIHSTCPSGKRAWEKRAHAKQAARKRANRGLDLLRAYQCAECNYFHIGHLNQTRKTGTTPTQD